MTENQKLRITELRSIGNSYSMISSITGIPVSSIKSFCQRNSLGGVRSIHGKCIPASINKCENCNCPVDQPVGRKHKRFCSDSCRMLWWNKHRTHIKRKTIHTFTCNYCGSEFERYGVHLRKFCSRDCYYMSRCHKEVIK